MNPNYVIKFIHVEEDEVDQELMACSVDSNYTPAEAIEVAQDRYLAQGHDFMLVSRITINFK